MATGGRAIGDLPGVPAASEVRKPEESIARFSESNVAPILKTPPPRTRSGFLWTARDPAYDEWMHRSVETTSYPLASALPILFSSLSTSLMETTASTDSFRDGRGVPEAGFGTFDWHLEGDASNRWYMASSRRFSLRDWERSESATIEVSAVLALILVYLLIRAMEPLIHRIFALDLTSPLRVSVEDALILPTGTRVLLINPPPEILERFELDASDGPTPSTIVVDAYRLLTSEGRTWLTARMQSLPPTLFIGGFELVISEPMVRCMLLELLESQLLNSKQTIVVASEIFPFEWLTSAAAGRERMDGFGAEKRSIVSQLPTSAGLPPAPPAAPPPSDEASLDVAEALRWSRVLAPFESRLCGRAQVDSGAVSPSGPDAEPIDGFPGDPLRATLAAASDLWKSVSRIWREVRVPAFRREAKRLRTQQGIEKILISECTWSEPLRRIRQEIEPAAQFERLTPREVQAEILARAEPHYRRLWNLCSFRERLALMQLAAGNLPNPRNLGALQSLLRKGLVEMSPELRLVSENFASFVRTAEPSHRLAEWRRAVTGGVWAEIQVPLLLALATGIGFVAYVSREAVDASLGVVGAVATVLPVVAKLLSANLFRSSSSGESAQR